MNEHDFQSEKDYIFSIPTGSEWEYAAKANERYKYSGSNRIDDVAWYDGNSSLPQPVMTKTANACGLYDMSGNIWEWCNDAYSKDYVGIHGPAQKANISNVRRGGSWMSASEGCTQTFR